MASEHVTQAELGDITVAYRRAGDGPNVVLIHGLAQDHTMWSRQQEDLDDYSTYAYDVRGFGGSSIGNGDRTLEQLGGDLLRFLEDVSGPAHCVGFSLGGTITLWAAAQRPDLVLSAVVLGTSSVVGRRAAEFYASRIEMVERGDATEFRDALREDTRGALPTGRVDLEAQTDYRIAAIGAGDGYINASAAMARVNQEPLTDDLARIRTEVGVIGAENDTFCPRRAADILMEGLPAATYLEIPAAGHLMVEEAPDESTAAIRKLISSSVTNQN